MILNMNMSEMMLERRLLISFAFATVDFLHRVELYSGKKSQVAKECRKVIRTVVGRTQRLTREIKKAIGATLLTDHDLAEFAIAKAAAKED